MQHLLLKQQPYNNITQKECQDEYRIMDRTGAAHRHVSNG